MLTLGARTLGMWTIGAWIPGRVPYLVAQP